MPRIDIRLDETETTRVVARLNELVSRGRNLGPAMLEISEEMMAWSQDAFEDERDPATGAEWPELAAETIQERTELGYWPGPILQRTRTLRRSVHAVARRFSAAVGSNLSYAAAHQFGRTTEDVVAFGAHFEAAVDRRERLPARPFLGWPPGASEDILVIVGRHLDVR